MNENLSIWERFADIDPKFTKGITGKAYKGTSPNPQYVIRCLTEIFGPVGEGFGWEVVREDFTPLGGEVLHWCRIRFWHTVRENAFDSYGQTKAMYPSRDGKIIVDEDAPKKSLTDAIIKAASHIGIAANIFLGRWDDSKYVEAVNADFRAEERKTAAPSADKSAPDWQALSDKMLRAVRNVGAKAWGHPDFKRDLANLKAASPELAAHVEAEIQTKQQAEAA